MHKAITNALRPKIRREVLRGTVTVLEFNNGANDMPKTNFNHLMEIENHLTNMQGAIDTLSQTEACGTDSAVAYLHGQMFDYARDLSEALNAEWTLRQGPRIKPL